MDFIDILISLVALIILEVVLGIDNIIMLTILTEKLPAHKRQQARKWGLTFSWMTRLILLAFAVYMVKMSKPLFTINKLALSAHDCFLIFGGAFLIWKSTDEIHHDVSQEAIPPSIRKNMNSAARYRSVIMQVALMDIIFSLDSVLTAVGLTNLYWIMALAITIAILIMIYASEQVSKFISRHPTLKMLALSYLILIGMVLIADGLSFHIPRGYLYFAMGFSLSVETLNILRYSRAKKIAGK